jgi:hypothetical protein
LQRHHVVTEEPGDQRNRHQPHHDAAVQAVERIVGVVVDEVPLRVEELNAHELGERTAQHEEDHRGHEVLHRDHLVIGREDVLANE